MARTALRISHGAMRSPFAGDWLVLFKQTSTRVESLRERHVQHLVLQESPVAVGQGMDRRAADMAPLYIYGFLAIYHLIQNYSRVLLEELFTIWASVFER